jgi:hypothetical protein
MRVELEAIKFNHDPESATSDALNIRKNETTPVTVPEWRRDRTLDSLAAYAISETLGNKITIQAKFKLIDSDVKSLEIRAIDPASIFGISELDDVVHTLLSWINPPSKPPTRNVLGRVKSKRVTFDEKGDSRFQTFELDDVDIWNVGVSVSTTIWQWQYRLGSQDAWTNSHQSRHQIYTVLKIPNEPWSRGPLRNNNIQLPWSDVLDHACAWASGAQTLDDAASLITHGVRKIETNLDVTWAPSHFYANSQFDCASFLDLLQDKEGAGKKLSCTDCATVVSSFANILGCELWQAIMVGGGSFFTNPVRLLGKTFWKPKEFTVHEVAWKGACTEDQEVFDACLFVDGDDNPVTEPHDALLPVNLRFGRLEDRQYLFRLAAPLASHPGSVLPHPGRRRQRRSIRPNRQPTKPIIDSELVEFSKSRYDYEHWHERYPLTNQVFIGELDLGALVFSGWVFVRPPDVVETSGWPLTERALIKRVGQFQSALVRLDIDLCVSARAARYFLLRRAAHFQTPNLVLQKDLPVGDFVMVESETGAVLFTRANLVVLVRNAGGAPVDLIDIARMIDEHINEDPGTPTPICGVLSDFSIPFPTAKIGSRIPILRAKLSKADLLQSYKIFFTGGDIRGNRQKLTYSPIKSGFHELRIFGYRPDGRLLIQKLNVDVKE